MASAVNATMNHVLEELMLAMTDKLTRFDMTKAIISRKYTMKIEQPSDDYPRMRFIAKDGLSDHGYMRTVFGGMGGYVDSESFFVMNPRVRFVYEKNGIEILGLEPNATGHTYSKKCSMTVKELKEQCKVNGIKPGKLDKVGLIRALMKLKQEEDDDEEFPVIYESNVDVGA